MGHYDDEPPEPAQMCGCGERHLYPTIHGIEKPFTTTQGQPGAPRCLIYSLLTRVDALEAREKKAQEELAECRRNAGIDCI